jgi:hypothetical protein
MDTPKDFLETEIQKILDILEKQCKTFRVEDNKPPFIERGVMKKESEAKSGQDA